VDQGKREGSRDRGGVWRIVAGIAGVGALGAAMVLPRVAAHAAGDRATRAAASAAAKAGASGPGRAPSRPSLVSALRTSGLSAAARAALKPKHTVTKPAATEVRRGLQRNVVVVKFVDGARVREEGSSAARRAKTDPPTLAARLDALKSQQAQLDDYDRALLKRKGLAPDQAAGQLDEARVVLKRSKLKHWRKVFDLDDDVLARLRLNAEIKQRRQGSDLSNYYRFVLDDGEAGEALADRLNKLDVVEVAYLAPVPTGADLLPPTGSFLKSQGYLKPAPTGIDADFAWTQPGGKGSFVKIIDVESGWNLRHEDLPNLFFTDGQLDDGIADQQHGTAVLGVMLARADGAGVTGIVPEASGGVVSYKRDLGIAYNQNVGESVLVASVNLSVGDVILIELQGRGPGNDGDCTACIYPNGKPSVECGDIAMEYWEDVFDAINAATAAGAIVVEAAGNGEMNLDDARYKGRFDRNVRNSGAIIVGAGESATRKPICWSNHGSRVDLQGWGDNVMTTGYGTPASFRANGGDANQWYTSTFGGTSSATPIVAGAVAALQGIQIANNNPPLDWYETADLLKKTGTAQTGGKNIGPLPNLKAAIGLLAPPVKAGAEFKTTVTLDGTLLDADHKVSGFQGARTRDLGDASSVGAIERLQFGERGDRPCFVMAEKGDVVKHDQLRPNDELNLCGDNGSTDRSLESVPDEAMHHDTFVRGVSVCNSTTNNSTRLKGAKVFLTRVEDDGSFSMISDPKTMERPNCDGVWHTPAMCPSGSVAAKLVVHIRPDGKDEVVSGLSLKCRKVNVTRTCVTGC
jgi:serine protease